MLKRFGMQDCNAARTPMESNLKLEKSLEAQHFDSLIVNSSAVSLLVVTSRPDLSAAVFFFSQFQCFPTEQTLGTCKEDADMHEGYVKLWLGVRKQGSRPEDCRIR